MLLFVEHFLLRLPPDSVPSLLNLLHYSEIICLLQWGAGLVYLSLSDLIVNGWLREDRLISCEPWPRACLHLSWQLAGFSWLQWRRPDRFGSNQKKKPMQCEYILPVISINTLYKWRVEFRSWGSRFLPVFILATQSGTDYTWAARWRQLIAINLRLDRKPAVVWVMTTTMETHCLECLCSSAPLL